MDPLIKLEDISVYGNGNKNNNSNHAIVKNIFFEINQHDTIGIVGPSGSGKTTLVKSIALLNYERTTGDYYYKQQKIIPVENEALLFKIRKNIIFIHQTPVLFKGTLKYNIEYGFKLRKRSIDKDYLDKLVSSFNLSHLIDRNVNLLSGGEKQRVCLLRAIALKPEILILDEPTQNLDPVNIKIIEDNLKKFVEDNGTVIIVTHNLFQAQRITNKLGILVDGQLIEFGSSKKLFENPTNQQSADFLSGKIIF